MPSTFSTSLYTVIIFLLLPPTPTLRMEPVNMLVIGSGLWGGVCTGWGSVFPGAQSLAQVSKTWTTTDPPTWMGIPL